jgi:predicted RND superfamily exporter protein
VKLVTCYADWVIEHPKTIWAIILALSLLAAWPHFSAKGRPVHIPLQDLELARDSAGNDTFRLDRADSFLVIEAPDLFSPTAVAAIRHLISNIESLSFIKNVFWIEDIPPLNMFDLSPGWLPEENADPSEYEDAKKRILAHPLVYGQLVSPDATTLLLPVRYDWIGIQEDADCTEKLLAVSRATAAKYPSAELKINLTGRVPLYLAAQQAFHANHQKFQIIGYLLVFAIATILFRDIATIVIVGAAPAISIYWTTGALKWLSIQSNDLTTVVLPVLITMVGLTDGVHLVMALRKRWQANQNRIKALHDAIAHVGVACLLTSLTTAIGFASLLLARSTPIRDFGLACSVGVLVTFVAVLTIIPGLSITRLGTYLCHEKTAHQDYKLENLRGFLNTVLSNYRTVSIIGGLLTLLCIAISLTLRPDARTINALPANSPATVALEHCNTSLGGIAFIRVVGDFSATKKKADFNVIQLIDQIDGFVSGEPLLRHPLSIKNLLDSFGKRVTATQMEFIKLLPPDLRKTFFDQASDQIQIYIRTQDLGTAAYTPVFRRLNRKLLDLEQATPGLNLELTGIPITSAQDVTLIVYDLVASLGTASLVILIVMICFYRSWRIGIVTLIPNLLPLALTGTLLVATGQNLAIVSVCALAVCIGIAVDDSIHFLTRFRQELESGSDVDAAIRATFFGVGGALVITTIILITGFATVLISPLPTHRMFSMMACATIGGALIGDLLFLPALLKWLIRKPSDILREVQSKL